MVYLDEVFSANDFVAGARFLMADITTFSGLAFADFAKVEIPICLKNLTAWRAKVAVRPSIAG